jgi:hypothetical protein
VLAVAAGEEEGAPVPLLLGVKNVVAEIEIEIGSGSILLLDWGARSPPPPKKNTRRGTNHSRQNFMVLMAAAASCSPANRESSPLSLSLSPWFGF